MEVFVRGHEVGRAGGQTARHADGVGAVRRRVRGRTDLHGTSIADGERPHPRRQARPRRSRGRALHPDLAPDLGVGVVRRDRPCQRRATRVLATGGPGHARTLVHVIGHLVAICVDRHRHLDDGGLRDIADSQIVPVQLTHRDDLEPRAGDQVRPPRIRPVRLGGEVHRVSQRLVRGHLERPHRRPVNARRGARRAHHTRDRAVGVRRRHRPLQRRTPQILPRSVHVGTPVHVVVHPIAVTRHLEDLRGRSTTDPLALHIEDTWRLHHEPSIDWQGQVHRVGPVGSGRGRHAITPITRRRHPGHRDRLLLLAPNRARGSHAAR